MLVPSTHALALEEGLWRPLPGYLAQKEEFGWCGEPRALKTQGGIPGWRSSLAPAFGPGRDPGDPGSNPQDNLTTILPPTQLSHRGVQWDNQLTTSMCLPTGLAGAPGQSTTRVGKKLKQPVVPFFKVNLEAELSERKL